MGTEHGKHFQYLIVDYGDIFIFNYIVFILANTDTMYKNTGFNEGTIKESIRSMAYTTIFILGDKYDQVHQCEIPEVQTQSLAIEDQTYSVSCGGEVGRSIKFVTVTNGQSILIVETWAQIATPPTPLPIGDLFILIQCKFSILHR